MATTSNPVQVLKNKMLSFFSGKSSALDTGNTQLIIQLIIQVIGFVILILVGFWVITQVKVNGPIYKQLTASSDLRADILPPPLFTINSFAALNEAYIGTVNADYPKRDKSLQLAKKYEVEFNAKKQYWREHILDDDLKGPLEEVIKSGENFFKIANEHFEPALKISTIAASTPLAEVAQSYELNKIAVDKFVALLESKNQQTIAKAASFTTTVLIALALFAILLLAFIVLYGIRQKKAVQKSIEALENDGRQNQEAVLNLLDEMGDLADGDLTVKAQVKENITGAIADSINYTIDSLRELVVGITRASEQVTDATAQAQNTSASLLSAAEKQSQQITETGNAVQNMTHSILEVSDNASQATLVAQRSLEAASQGSLAVQNTIAGMNEIRTQIQETSKRIKRLGESSQEISEIVELISDITEQTNILALNAAIQAASAGEAGRGFTVVAEEVQRLAERSSEATKQISAIVKIIQNDTNSAVAAMEKSTEGVVEGAKLSDAAGQALSEIETVTRSLASIIDSITTAASAQTEVAATVSQNMQQIQDVTQQTTEGTKSTANSVGQLNSLAEELRASVAGFKLN